MRPTNSNSAKWWSCMCDVGDGYSRWSCVVLKRFSDGSKTRLIVSSRNSLNTPSWSMPASSRPCWFINRTRITPFSACEGNMASCRYPSSTIRSRWIVIKADVCDAHADSVRPNTAFSLCTYFRNSLTRSSCGMMWGIFRSNTCACFLPFSRSPRNVDGRISEMSQWFLGVNSRRLSRRYKHNSSVCNEVNSGDELIAFKSAKS